jgi:hypothetical protein
MRFPHRAHRCGAFVGITSVTRHFFISVIARRAARCAKPGQLLSKGEMQAVVAVTLDVALRVTRQQRIASPALWIVRLSSTRHARAFM